MPKFMPKALTIGQEVECPICEDNGVKCTVHVEEKTYQGNTRLSWRNQDGSGHIGTPPGFVHKTGTQQQGNNGNSGPNPIRSEIEEYKVWLNRSGNIKTFAAHYHAAREIFEESCTDVLADKRGMVVGNMLTNYFSTHPNPFEKFGSTSSPTETRRSLTAKTIYSFQAASSVASSRFTTSQNLAVKGRVENQDPLLKIEQDLTNLANPIFSDICVLCFLAKLHPNILEKELTQIKWKDRIDGLYHKNGCKNKGKKTLYKLGKEYIQNLGLKA